MTANDDANDEQEQTDEQTTVTVANVSEPGIFAEDGHTGGNAVISPWAYAVTEERENPLFATGEQVSEGITRLAEAGQPDTLVSEVEGTDGVKAVNSFGNGPMGPDATGEFTVDVSEQGYLSLAAMVVPSNDMMVATAAPIPLRFKGERLTDTSGRLTAFMRIYDAGTEPNAAHGQGPDQAPAQGSPLQGEDEGNAIRQVSTVNDDVLTVEPADLVELTFE